MLHNNIKRLDRYYNQLIYYAIMCSIKVSAQSPIRQIFARFFVISSGVTRAFLGRFDVLPIAVRADAMTEFRFGTFLDVPLEEDHRSASSRMRLQ